MSIRQIRTNNQSIGKSYIACLILGRHVDVDTEDWPTLCARIEQQARGQSNFLDHQLLLKLELSPTSVRVYWARQKKPGD